MDSNILNKVFICFAAEDRYSIVEPIVYHLKNYGIETWYDRHSLLMGDNRIEKNLIEGAMKCKYAVVILSKHTIHSKCAMEEINIVKSRELLGEVFVFPVLYEISPDELPYKLEWIKKIIFKEVDKQSGTRQICNHFACRITKNLLHTQSYRQIQDILVLHPKNLPISTYEIIYSYNKIDTANLNARISLLYSAYLTIKCSMSLDNDKIENMACKIFEYIFSETLLNLSIDYREIWLLENSICLLVNFYLDSCNESKM